MRYTKPYILATVTAATMIQSGTEKQGGPVDSIPESDNPAYEGDE